MTGSEQSRQRVPRVLRRLWSWGAVLVIVLAVSISVLRVGLLWADNLIPHLEQELTAWVGETVEIGDLRVQWRVVSARVTLGDVTVLDQHAQDVLFGVGEVQVDLHVWRSWWQQQPVFSDLTIRRADVHVLRDEAGVVRVYGAPVGMDIGTPDADRDVLGLIAGQHLLLERSRLRWEDRRLGIDYQFHDLQLAVVTEPKRVQLAGQVFLPEYLGDSLHVAMDMHLEASARDWSGLAYLRGQSLHGSGLPESLRQQLGLDKAEIQTSVWLNWMRGEVRRAQALVSIEDLLLLPFVAQPSIEAVKFDHLAGHFLWEQQASGWQMRGHDLRVQRGTRFWPESGFDLQVTQEADRQDWRISLDHARLEDIWPFILAQQSWSVPGADWLQELQPGGVVQSLSAHIQLSKEDQPSLQLQASLRDGQTLPARGIPGFQGIHGDVVFYDGQGELQIYSDSAAITAPRLFTDALAIQSLAASFDITQHDQGVSLVSDSIALSNQDVALQLRGEFDLQADAGMILEGQFGSADIRRVSHYLPRGIMPPIVVTWLENALLQGEIAGGEVQFRGRFKDFPFPQDQGVFEVRADVRDVGLQFHPEWPSAEQVQAELIFKNAGMEVREASGRLRDTPVVDLSVRIEDFGRPVLDLSGIARGDLPGFQSYLLATPLAALNQAWLEPLQLQGVGQLELGLQMELRDRHKHANPDQLQGRFSLLGTRLMAPGLPWPLEDIQGDLRFDLSSLSSRNLTAKLNSEAIRLDVRREPDAHVYIEALGLQPIETLLQELPEMVRDHLSGSALWRAQLQFAPQDPPHLRLRSDTRGVVSRLPSLLAKTADEAWLLDLRMDLLADGPAGVRLSLGESGGERLFLRGRQEAPHWLWQMDSPAVSGELRWPFEPSAEQGLRAELRYVRWAELGFPEDRSERARIDPHVLPALDVSIDALHLNERILHDLRWQSVPFDQGLRLLSASVASRDQYLQAEAQGEWRIGEDAEHRTEAHIRFFGDDLGQGLSALNINHNISGGRVLATARVHWPDAATHFALEIAEAQGELNIEEGRLLEVEPGAGRWLGLFSLNMLPRRLALDFRDVFQRGLVFDEFKGAFDLQQGQLYTPDLLLHGPAARIQIRGRTGLLAQDYDQMILVSPNVRSTLPLAGAFLGGPVAGIAVFLFERIAGLGDRLDDSMRLEYHVTGPWNAPEVEAQVREIATTPSP
ncbi:Uncharacterized conserved protein YhdP, contains DUF3971 and AsmA2 domains [Ectothiorhodosinus mongolicus]|uniref:Uncharacterized conserved protein YhdP, contains DUF3971 and AsmA2 domains n=1 Tax=Ectothiorhodosinus mongolicus TaxID=233100 RepID=A0A1R3VP68_9GAMM|nr:DUF3971 domain-containing protein [Ectothiorhodosinus mongolicus]SIT66434.1 Uncharacterized conserved protein YhdP, contains DUF3971 and AsmA2 domains [Ectothiorhodosinus mongolicus]